MPKFEFHFRADLHVLDYIALKRQCRCNVFQHVCSCVYQFMHLEKRINAIFSKNITFNQLSDLLKFPPIEDF